MGLRKCWNVTSRSHPINNMRRLTQGSYIINRLSPHEDRYDDLRIWKRRTILEQTFLELDTLQAPPYQVLTLDVENLVYQVKLSRAKDA